MSACPLSRATKEVESLGSITFLRGMGRFSFVMVHVRHLIDWKILTSYVPLPVLPMILCWTFVVFA